MKSIFSFVALFVRVGYANNIKITNNCPFAVWPGIVGSSGTGQPDGGGFSLESKQSKSVEVPSDWSGRIWGRTNCDGNGHCETGDCGDKIQCNGAGAVPPVTLAEITFKGARGLDYYDVSLIDGFNLPIEMAPVDGFVTGDNGQYYCKTAGCDTNVNAVCPDELAVKRGNTTVACKSACEAFKTDRYCCRAAYNSEQTCNSSNWPVNYPALFAQACPNTFIYLYDEVDNTFMCNGDTAVIYEVTFCP